MSNAQLPEERIIPKISLGAEKIVEILATFGLTPTSEPRDVGGGRIANNLIATTRELGEVIIRHYPKSYSAGKVAFEVEALCHLASRGLSVPAPLPLVEKRSSRTYLYCEPDIDIFLYQALPGKTISQDMLSVEIAQMAGRTLATLAPHALEFRPSTLNLHGDLGFIAGLLRAAKERDSDFAANVIAAEMEDAVADGRLINALEHSQLGLVHADYFFENLLIKDSRVTGILDFGDAYFGRVINDAVIGAMEFAVTKDEMWSLEMWRAFLEPNIGWLRNEGLSAPDMRRLLLANCVRFAVYTLPFTHDEGMPIDSNKYVRRFREVKNTSIGNDLEAIWRDLIG